MLAKLKINYEQNVFFNQFSAYNLSLAIKTPMDNDL